MYKCFAIDVCLKELQYCILINGQFSNLLSTHSMSGLVEYVLNVKKNC